MEEREYINLDDIKYMARTLYGVLPKDAIFATKTYTLSYSSANEFSSVLDLGNPMYVTNIQVATNLDAIESDIYISVSATDSKDETAFNLGEDGDMNVGSIWKYIKASGSNENGAILTITLTGYILDYGGATPPQPKTQTAMNVVRRVINTDNYIQVDTSVLLSPSTLVFKNGVLLRTGDYILNRMGSTTTIGYITFNDGVAVQYDEICVVY